MRVLITGAASGIGYATALELLKKGHFIYLTVHTEGQLHQVQQKKELPNSNVRCLKLDITKEEDRAKVKDLDIDVLINNAAVGQGGSIVEADIGKIRENYEVNVFGTIEMTQLYLKKMVERNNGRIVTISSMAGELPFPWMGIYSSTKAALTNLFMTLSQELKEVKSNVKISVIEPGIYRTGFNEVMMDNKYDDEDSIFKKFRERIYTTEQFKFNILASEDLKSIVDKIVKAVEDKEPDLIYKAPFTHSVIEKAIMIVNK